MVSEVDICNLALSHLGGGATVSSLDPPEGSAQAEYCATYYPVARDTLLEMHPWGFAMMRKALPLMAEKSADGLFCYGLPPDCLRVVSVLSGRAYGETSLRYFREMLPDGQQVLYADVPDALLRYVSIVRDTSRFPPLFVAALSWHLAAMLAGVVMKGDVGAQFAALCESQKQRLLQEARNSDGLQFKQKAQHTAPWMKGR